MIREGMVDFSRTPWVQVAAAQFATTAPQWQELELMFTATRDTANPYTDSEAWADFTHDDGTQIRRPMFWDGGRNFRVRFRYLMARYGARSAIWPVGGDGPDSAPNTLEQWDLAGRTIRQWDAYRQPIGIHCSPYALNRTHRDKDWLDFQWCQTGHNGEHVPGRVAVPKAPIRRC